jgi:hypothetical protein
LLFGLIVVAIGIGWLLEAFDVANIRWDVILPSTLILVGLVLLLTAWRGGSQGGLIALGIVLSVVLLAGTVADIPLEGGVGQRVARPRSVEALHREYRLAVGDMTIDLTELPQLQGSFSIRAQLGIGHLLVLVPRAAVVHVQGRAGIGQVAIFGQEHDGFDVHGSYDSPVSDGRLTPRYALDVSVGIGQVEVRYG